MVNQANCLIHFGSDRFTWEDRIMGYRAKALAIESHGGKDLYLQVNLNNHDVLRLKGEATIFPTKEQTEKAIEKYRLYYNWIIEEK